jgi:3-isopropylmalate dehydrogenase
MALRYSFHRGDIAEQIEWAVEDVLSSGTRTPDVMAPDCTLVGTAQMGDALIANLTRLKAEAA